MGAVPGAHDLHAFIAAPEVEVLQVRLFAGGNGKAGMEVKIGDGFH